MPTPTIRRPILIGANPLVSLFDGDVTTCFASIWLVEWSTRGRGEAMVLWHEGQLRVLGADPDLAWWLAQDFTRHFPEARGLAWPEHPTVERARVAIDLDMSAGLRAEAAAVVVSMSGVLDRRVFDTDAFDLSGVPHGLSLVTAPVSHATITVAGRRLPGEVRVSGTPDRPSSSGFLTSAEVWWRPSGDH